MWHIVWEFRVVGEKRSEFEQVYGSAGAWAKFFTRSTEFCGTTLLRDPRNAGRYLTIDKWKSSAAYEQFCQEFAAEYKQLDVSGEALTEYEMKIGAFEAVGFDAAETNALGA